MVDRESDDLTRIKGIGPSRQKWFRETLGVTSFDQLAKLSPDVVEAALREDGRIVSRSTIEEWMVEAARIVAEEGGSGRGQGGPFRNNGWSPVASFVVEFQERRTDDQTEQRTLVHHMESAEEQTLIHEIEEAAVAKTWPGLESRQLCEWMMKRLVAKKGEKSAVGQGAGLPAPDVSPVAHVEMRRIQICQPSDAGIPLVVCTANGESPVPAFVKGNEPFTIEAVFSIDGQEAGYEAVFYLKNIATGARQQLGDPCTGVTGSGESSCAVDLDHPSIAPGLYQLAAVVTLSGGQGGAGYLQTSRLQVI